LSLKEISLLIGSILILVLLTACQTQPNQIFIEVDGARQALTTEAKTVRDALAEAGVVLNALDRVTPDLYAQLDQGLVIVVIRVREELETKREIIPFQRQTVVNEALARGETRLAQLGVNGEDEITIRVIYENDVEVSRAEISRVAVIEPAPEILVIGPQDELPSIPLAGAIAYLANGNAWLIRDNSGSHRALTTEGNLDGRVLSLSPDGRHLLYTTHLTTEIDLPLNELWLASTTIVGEKPVTLGIQGTLKAEWSPIISQSLVAYTTAERTANPPGWRANNDLWLLDLARPSAKPVKLLSSNTQGLYPWWGTSFTWSPDGTRLAYARADQIGLIQLEGAKPISSSNITPLIDFTPLQTFSDWVWVPVLSWSPDGRFIAAALHGPPLAAEPAEESEVFDLWLLSAEGTFSAKVANQVGMWANPAWGESGIAFGQATNPLQSANSRYNIYLIDKDGSNKRQLFPFREELGVQFPELVWSPDGQDLLFIYNGNLYLTSREGGLPRQLTVDGQASHPQWALAPVITATLSLTGTQPISDSQAITASSTLTPTGVISGTPTPSQATPTPVTRTPTPTLTPSPQPTAVPTVIFPTATLTATRQSDLEIIEPSSPITTTP
jgi:Tol biopolymer transport system component